MSSWGTPWGLVHPWGTSGGAGPAKYCQLAQDRVLIQMDDTLGTRNLRDLVCILAEPKGNLEDVAFDVQNGFDVETAVGVQLDTIGAIIGLPRQGFNDVRYRVFLRIQIDLILSAARDGANWTGTHNNILSICRTFIGSGVPDPIVLLNFAPYNFTLSVPGVTLSELDLLLSFICKALYAGVLGQVIIILGPNSLWDSDYVGPIPDGGVWCSDSVAVPNCATWGTVVPVGTCPC